MSIHSFSRGVGIGSSAHDVGFDWRISFLTSDSDNKLNDEKVSLGHCGSGGG